MDTSPGNPDEKRILESVRASLAGRARIPERAAEPSPRIGADEQPPDFATLDGCFDIYNVPLSSNRAWSGSVLVLCKRIVRQLMAPVLQRQIQHNAAVSHALRALWHRAMPEQEQFWAAAEQLEQLRRTVRKEAEDLQSLRLETGELRRELEALRLDLKRERPRPEGA